MDASRMDPPGLDQLRQLALPPLPDWWPRTWGWAVLAVVVLGIVLAMSIRALRRRHANRYRRLAMTHLEHMREAAVRDRRAARALPVLLKRTALSETPGYRVGTLRGQAWVDHLQGAGRSRFPAGTAALLATLAYGQESDVAAIPEASLHELFDAVGRWLDTDAEVT